jgi:S1-C subfamily serine protease
MDTASAVAIAIVGVFLTFVVGAIRAGIRANTTETKRLNELKLKADGGDIQSMLALADALGTYYAEGHKYLELAAANGSDLAQYRLGGLIYGKPQRAFELFLKSAEAGYEPAMAELGLRYLNGTGVLKNIASSTEWFIKAAEKGNRESQMRVSKAYFDGFGVQENPLEGLAWLYFAEFSGSAEAAVSIKNLSKTLNNSTLLAAQNRAKQLLELCKKGESSKESASFSPLIRGGELGQQMKKPSSSPKGSGSGTIVSSVGHIVTAAHVIKGAQFVEAVTAAGTFAATVESIDEANDLALLKIDKVDEHFVRVAHSRDVRLGQSVATIGFPNIGIQGHSPKVTQGVISGEYGIQNDIRMWQVSVQIQPGNSGGPLLDESGALVGVIVASLSLRTIQSTGAIPQNVNYAIKSAYLEPILNYHKVAIDQTGKGAALKFEDMVDAAKKSSVLILVY